MDSRKLNRLDKLLTTLKEQDLTTYNFVRALNESDGNISKAVQDDDVQRSRQWFYKSFTKEEQEMLKELAHDLHTAPLEKALYDAQEASVEAVDTIKMILALKPRSVGYYKLKLQAAQEILKLVGAYAPDKHVLDANMNSQGKVEVIVKYADEEPEQ